MWNYPETTHENYGSGAQNGLLRIHGADEDYLGKSSQELFLCETKEDNSGIIDINVASADNLTHLPNESVDVIGTDPPYYDSVRYGEISDFFYVWLRVNLFRILPKLFKMI